MSENNFFVYTLQDDDEGKKLEDILYRRFHFSRKLLQKLKLGEHVWLDGKFVFLNTNGKSGQTLMVDLLEEEEATIEGENLPLDVIFEDAFFLAVNKPPGQVVHPTSFYQSGTLANAVVGYWKKKGESRPFRPISRIDRNTSGIVVIAKNRFAHQQLAWLSKQKKVEKKYLGLVQGQMSAEQGKIDFPIRLVPNSKIIREVHPQGQPSLTYFQTLKRFKNYSLLEFTLITGRTHQIRVHCQALGHPLLGDDLYGGNTEYIKRQALHSSFYSFVHPLTSKIIKIEASLPSDMASLI